MITRRAFARHVGGIVSAIPYAGEGFLGVAAACSQSQRGSHVDYD
jgi:hypothetical protein